jgi:hypothetical protein
MLVVNVAGDVKVSRDLHGAIVPKLQEAARLMNEPQLSGRGLRCVCYTAERPADDHAMLRVAFLCQH